MLNIIGGLLIAWGVLDFALSWMGTDLYGEIGIIIPEPFWNYTAYVVGAVGLGVIAIGKSLGGDATQDDE
jgi:hypothetical protein